MKNTIYKKIFLLGILTILIGTNYTIQISGDIAQQNISKNLLQKEIDDDEFSKAFIPGEIIVKFKPGLSPKTKTSADITKIGITSIDTLNEKFCINNIDKVFKNKKSNDAYGLSNFYKFVFPENKDIFSIIEEYQTDPNVEYAGPNPIMSLYLEPNDPYYSSSGSWGQDYPDMYGLHLINASGAWDVTTGSDEVVVAIVDSGVDYNHEDLAGNMWINEDENATNGIDDDGDGFIDNIYGADIFYNDSDPIDDHGHGTHCAGIIAAVGNNSLGVVGANWQAKIMAIKSFNNLGFSGSSTLASAIVWAADNGANVISNSWGPEYRRPSQPIIEAAIKYAYDAGCVIVFAAGNAHEDVKYYSPQNMAETLTVAATDYNDEKAAFSNWGEKVDVCAPGVDILSLRANNTDMYNDGTHIVDDNYYRASGTSMSCPLVAGLTALLLSKNQSYDKDTLRTIIEYSVDEVNISGYQYIRGGRINASKAIQRPPAAIRLDSFSNPTDIKGLTEINGTAWGENFQYYRLEYGRGQNPAIWTTIINSSTSIQNDVFATIDTLLLDDGYYSIRLLLVCSDNTYEKNIWMVVNNEYNTLIVDDTGGPEVDYFTIQEAVDDAGHNDSIYVKNGTYYEGITISKTISLQGEDKNSTIINGNGKPRVVNLYADQIIISGFTIQNTNNISYSTGIRIDYDVNGADSCTITDNIIKNHRYGIYIGYMGPMEYWGFAWGSSHNIVTRNEIHDNLEIGIGLHRSNFNNISDNIIYNNDRGINFYTGSKNNSISNNVILNNTNGIYFHQYHQEGSNNNTFLSNLITLNDWGVYIKAYNPPEDNIFYHNNFVENTHHAYDEFSNNWYNSTLHRGNYWDDFDESYEGAWDNDSDGIVDSPYNISGGENQDRYPLLGIFGWNTAPDIPSRPSGKTLGITNRPYSFFTSCDDPDGDLLLYNFSWDDGTYSGWIGPYSSGEEISTFHTWSSDGKYQIKVRAKDAYGVESNWSENLSVFIYEGFILNLIDFPMYQAQSYPPLYNESQMTGPAVAQMNLNYMFWNSSQDLEPPMIFDDQLVLYNHGIANNSIPGPYFDASGLLSAIQDNRPLPYSEYGYNFATYHNTNRNIMLAQICQWVDYPAGIKPGHPIHVPGAIPAFGDYSRWMSVRGIHTNISVYPLPDSFDVYGLWVNDPYPSGIGENTYKMPNEMDYYYQPIDPGLEYAGEYVAICEPPIEQECEITLRNATEFWNLQPPARKGGSQSLMQVFDHLIIHAAREGVKEQLIPYDDDFANVFEQTYPGRPLFIKNLVKEKHNYYAIPFNKRQTLSWIPKDSHAPPEEDITQVVVLVDATNGQFKEASWVYEPANYLPLTRDDALDIVFGELIDLGYNPDELNVRQIDTDLVYRDSSPYYPDWRVIISELGMEFFINQDGAII